MVMLDAMSNLEKAYKVTFPQIFLKSWYIFQDLEEPFTLGIVTVCVLSVTTNLDSIIRRILTSALNRAVLLSIT